MKENRNVKDKRPVLALAQLDRTSAEIVAERCADLESEIAVLKARSDTGFHGYCAWRRTVLREADDVLYPYDSPCVIASFVWHTIVSTLFTIGVMLCTASEKQRVATGMIVAVLVVHMLVEILCAGSVRDEFYAAKARASFMRFFAFPIMPFVRVADLIILKKRLGEHGEKLAEKEYLLSNLSASSGVLTHYLEAIKIAREELLGESSELRKIEKNLHELLAGTRNQADRVKKQAVPEIGIIYREHAQSVELRNLLGRELILASTLNRVKDTFAVANALLDACGNRIQKLDTSLFFRSVTEVTEHHVEIVRDCLVRLTSAIADAPRALPTETSDDHLDAYIKRVESLVERIAAIGIAEPTRN